MSNVHVMPASADRWKVCVGGSTLNVFPSRELAIEAALPFAEDGRGGVVIHGEKEWMSE